MNQYHKAAQTVSKTETSPGKTGLIGQWRGSEILAFCARVLLGAVFVYASIDKIAHPEAFAKAIYNYQILPETLINLTAIVLPWLELVMGVLLVLGVWQHGAVFLANVLLGCFFGALLLNLIRGLDIDCGCFTTSQASDSHGSMIWYVFRDSFFMALGVFLGFQTLMKKVESVRLLPRLGSGAGQNER
jgi:uncharacterized membrane protein YphA (DoxX/SURF4 family)